MAQTLTVEQLVAVGGTLWERDGMRRVYFDPTRWYGLELSFYGSGNISSATLDGATISNSRAWELAQGLAQVKVWFDASDGKFHGRGFNGSVRVGRFRPNAADFQEIVNAITAAC